MEHRDDLEHLLLDGLPEDERRHVVETIADMTAKKLAHLRALSDGPDIPEQQDDENTADLENA